MKIAGGLAGVRKRPGMYVGSTSFSGVWHMIFEIVGNSIDQCYARNATEVSVDVTADSWIAVRDDGAGLPPASFERVLLELHTGPTFDGHLPHVHVGNLRGVGLAAVNALSARFEIESTRDGVRWTQAFERGEPVTELHRLGTSTEEGTLIRFRPDPTIFASIEIDLEAIRARLQELAWLLPHVRVFFQGQRLLGRGGVLGWARELVAPRTVDVAYGFERYEDDVRVDIGVAWGSGDVAPKLRSFANTLETSLGGKHVEGFWQGIADYARGIDAREREVAAAREALEPGLAAVIHVELLDPSFGGPTKDHLSSPIAAMAVRKAVRTSLEKGLVYATTARDVIHARLGAK